MKGVILAGGTGTRLNLCTKVTNKHLLPVYDRPMIFYPLKTLVDAGIKKILIVTGLEEAGHFLKLLGSGKDFGAELTYRLQDDALGIAQALSLAEDFLKGEEKFVVILGDNIIQDNIRIHIEEFEKGNEEARLFLKDVPDAYRFGVVEIKEGKILGIEEKPKTPKSNYAVTGLYMYNKDVFDIIRPLKPSERGEIEITDVNNEYIKKGSLKYFVLKGYWSDAGTFESLNRATQLVKGNHENKAGA